MQIAQVLAGYTLGGADLLRRAMGKKKAEEMAKEKEGFLDGAKAQQVDLKIADAGLRAHGVLRRLRLQPVALGRVRLDHLPDRVPQAPLPARVHGGPDVVRRRQHRQHRQVHRRGARDGPGRRAARTSTSRVADFTVTPRADAHGGKVIRFGLGAVKGVGANAVEAILEARAADGQFESIFDFAAGSTPRSATGACSSSWSRAARSTACRATTTARSCSRRLDAAHRAWRVRAARSAQRPDLAVRADRSGRGPTAARGAGDPGRDLSRASRSGRPSSCSRSRRRRSGFYVSGHPLDRYRGDLTRYATATTSDFTRGRAQRSATHSIGGIVSQYREMITKKGDKMARFQLEDSEGTLEVIAFPKTFEKVRHVLVSRRADPVHGRGQERGHVGRTRVEDAAGGRGAAVRAAAGQDQPGRHPPRRRPAHPRSGRRAQDHPGERATRCTSARWCA